MDRRGFLGAILAAGVAPAFVKYGSLMRPVGIIVPPLIYPLEVVADYPAVLDYALSITLPYTKIVLVADPETGLSLPKGQLSDGSIVDLNQLSRWERAGKLGLKDF